MPAPAPFQIFHALEQTPVAAWVRESSFAFPLLDALHVACVMLVFGSIAILDLRLLGVGFRSTAVTRISRRSLPWTWGAFALAAVSGALLMSGQAGAYAINTQFRIKMALMAAAALNMAVFHFVAWPGVSRWDEARVTPRAARLAGGLSLALWIGVVVAGRWVGWTVSASPF